MTNATVVEDCGSVAPPPHVATRPGGPSAGFTPRKFDSMDLGAVTIATVIHCNPTASSLASQAGAFAETTILTPIECNVTDITYIGQTAHPAHVLVEQAGGSAESSPLVVATVTKADAATKGHQQGVSALVAEMQTTNEEKIAERVPVEQVPDGPHTCAWGPSRGLCRTCMYIFPQGASTGSTGGGTAAKKKHL